MKRLLWPLGALALLLALLGAGLHADPRALPSALAGRAAPSFSLPRLDAPGQTLGPADMRGQAWLLNVWASWCAACREEHPPLMALAASGAVPIVGLDYKDAPADAHAWLARHGNPYRATVADARGLVGIDWGVYGVPETFLIDRDGIVRQRFTGPLTAERIRDEVLPLLKALDG